MSPRPPCWCGSRKKAFNAERCKKHENGRDRRGRLLPGFRGPAWKPPTFVDLVAQKLRRAA